MIHWALIEEIKAMLEAGEYSQREIAVLLKVSRGTVSAVSGGRYRLARVELHSAEEHERDEGPYERCSGCGGMVHLPCRLCYVRDLKQVEKTHHAMSLRTRRPR